MMAAKRRSEALKLAWHVLLSTSAPCCLSSAGGAGGKCGQVYEHLCDPSWSVTGQAWYGQCHAWVLVLSTLCNLATNEMQLSMPCPRQCKRLLDSCVCSAKATAGHREISQRLQPTLGVPQGQPWVSTAFCVPQSRTDILKFRMCVTWPADDAASLSLLSMLLVLACHACCPGQAQPRAVNRHAKSRLRVSDLQPKLSR